MTQAEIEASNYWNLLETDEERNELLAETFYVEVADFVGSLDEVFRLQAIMFTKHLGRARYTASLWGVVSGREFPKSIYNLGFSWKTISDLIDSSASQRAEALYIAWMGMI